MKKEEYYKTAVELWGEGLQIVVATEEMSRLSSLILKSLRPNIKVHKQDILGALASVDVMIEQLRSMYNDQVSFCIHKKGIIKKLTKLAENDLEKRQRVKCTHIIYFLEYGERVKSYAFLKDGIWETSCGRTIPRSLLLRIEEKIKK